MHDLYALLNLSPTATRDEIEASLPRLRWAQQQQVRDVLLIDARRRAYDHAYRAMRMTAELRERLELTDTESWTAETHQTWYSTAHRQRSAQDPQADDATPSDATTKRTSTSDARRATVLAVVLVIVVFLVITNGARDRSNTSTPSAIEEKARAVLDRAVTTPETQPEIILEADSLRRPAHGRQFVSRGEASVGGIHFKAHPTNDFYFKVVNVDTRRIVRSFYMRAGRDYEVKLPLGTYRVLASVGPAWYGPKRGFGKYSSAAEFEADFVIEEDGDHVTGYTVTLTSVAGGTLRQSEQDPEAFSTIE